MMNASIRRERLLRPRKKRRDAPPMQMTDAIVCNIGNMKVEWGITLNMYTNL